ncbi:MAG: helix-turn-helix domain-containing protein [Candidatus Binatia bacterium]
MNESAETLSLSEKLFSPCDLAIRFGVSAQTIKNWSDKGKFPAIRLSRGRRVFRGVDVEKFARELERKRS